MKKYLFSMAAVALMAAPVLTSCDDDDDVEDLSPEELAIASMDCTPSTQSAWGNYMRIVANLLVSDAQTLNDNWNTQADGKTVSYAEYFKSLKGLEAAQQIADGCYDIANEVGEAKIGDPLGLYEKGATNKALFAVESWFSWHSRDDYSNNILSIRNSLFGTLDGTESSKSLAAAVKAVKPTVYAETVAAITAAYSAIQAIPQPFRSNINSTEAKLAQVACAALGELLHGNFKSALESVDDATLKTAVAEYVDSVVIPTYANLLSGNKALQTAVVAFQENPSDDAFAACAKAWLAARQPWETSEAFLFGPVADLGLDPNMDSWPLDLTGINNILTSGNYDELNWSGNYKEKDENIEAAQALRGFHTLEFLVFKDGEARTIVSVTATE